MHIISDVLKAHEFFRVKNIKVDLVILNLETNVYEQYIKQEIENTILNKQIEYLKNKQGGIYEISGAEIDGKTLELLRFRANLKINANLGKIETQLKDLEEDYMKSISRLEDEPEILNTVEEEKVCRNI